MSVLAVWHVDLERAGADERLAPLLSPAERHRCTTLAGRRRREYLASHAAVRLILGELTGRRPAALRWRCSSVGKPGPVLGTAWHWNLSHAAGRAAVAVSESGPVGVDLVCVKDFREPVRIAERFFNGAEAELVRTAAARGWCCARLLARKEACLKAAGLRLFDGLGIDVAADGCGRDAAGRRWAVLDLKTPQGWAAALATGDPGPLEPVEHHWSWPEGLR
jgi:4'-phosphopantetheinyl transferase